MNAREAARRMLELIVSGKRGERSCGDCTLCCTVMFVEELPKERGVRCPNVCRGGCKIYDARPQSCRDFACLWWWSLPGFEDGDRPDRIGLVFDTAGAPSVARDPSTGDHYPLFAAHERRPGSSSSPRAQALIERLNALGIAVSINGRERVRRVYLPGLPGKLERLVVELPRDHRDAQMSHGGADAAKDLEIMAAFTGEDLLGDRATRDRARAELKDKP